MGMLTSMEDLDPAHHGVAVKNELLGVGLDLVGGKLGGLARQLLVKGARLQQNALALLFGERAHGAGHGADLVEHARGLEPVQDPRPGHKAHANKDDDDGDEPVGPARQPLATALRLWLRFGLGARVAVGRSVIALHMFGALHHRRSLP